MPPRTSSAFLRPPRTWRSGRSSRCGRTRPARYSLLIPAPRTARSGSTGSWCRSRVDRWLGEHSPCGPGGTMDGSRGPARIGRRGPRSKDPNEMSAPAGRRKCRRTRPAPCHSTIQARRTGRYLTQRTQRRPQRTAEREPLLPLRTLRALCVAAPGLFREPRRSRPVNPGLAHFAVHGQPSHPAG